MKASLLVAISIMPVAALADDPLPKRPDFNRYKAMLDRSPFAVATVAVSTATPDFAKDLFVANAARSGEGGFVTLTSATDRNFKEYLTTKGPNEHGWGISDIQWSDQIGQTKVTITKDSKYATLTFNQALLSQAAQSSIQLQTNAVQPPIFPPGMPALPQPYQKPAPIPSLPPSYQQPRPNLPQPGQIHQRGVIQRNPTPIPTPIVPVPNVPPPEDDDSEE
jgi:hypothetical protein